MADFATETSSSRNRTRDRSNRWATHLIRPLHPSNFASTSSSAPGLRARHPLISWRTVLSAPRHNRPPTMELYNAYYEWAGNVGDSILKLAQPDAVPTPPTQVRRRERAAAAAGRTSFPLTPAASHWLATASRTPAPRAPRGTARPRSARRPPVHHYFVHVHPSPTLLSYQQPSRLRCHVPPSDPLQFFGAVAPIRTGPSPTLARRSPSRPPTSRSSSSAA